MKVSARESANPDTATTAEDNIWTIAMVEAGKLSDQQKRTVALSEVYRP